MIELIIFIYDKQILIYKALLYDNKNQIFLIESAFWVGWFLEGIKSIKQNDNYYVFLLKEHFKTNLLTNQSGVPRKAFIQP